MSVDADPESALHAINDLAINILLIPDVTPSAPSLNPKMRESAERRFDSCYLYSADGALDDPDLTVEMDTDPLEE